MLENHVWYSFQGHEQVSSTNLWTESEGMTLVPGDTVKLENDMMRFVMRNDSNTLNLVVDIPRLLDFEIMVRFITQGA